MVNEQSSSIENNVFSLLKSSHNMQRANKELIQSNNECDLNEQSARSPVDVTGPVSSVSRIGNEQRKSTAQQHHSCTPLSAAARAKIAEV